MSSPIGSSAANRNEDRRILDLHSQAPPHGKESKEKDDSLHDRMNSFIPGIRGNNSEFAPIDRINRETNPVQITRRMSVKESELGEINLGSKLSGNKLAVYQKLMLDRKFGSEIIELKKYELDNENELLEKSLTLNRKKVKVEQIQSPFHYKPTNPKDVFEVTLNFSDSSGLFFYCFTELFAQDEIQAMEFPLSFHLIEYAKENKPTIIKFDEGKVQAALIRNFPRFGEFDLDGIYGNNFSKTSEEQVMKQTKRIENPSRHNILAMAALPVAPLTGGSTYDAESIKIIFETAYTGFAAAKKESKFQPLIINTGNWGCGAFGNDPVLMAIIQILAAELVGANKVNYFTLDPKKQDLIDQAQAWIQKNIHEYPNKTKLDVKTIIEIIANSQSFKFGTSHGN